MYCTGMACRVRHIHTVLEMHPASPPLPCHVTHGRLLFSPALTTPGLAPLNLLLLLLQGTLFYIAPEVLLRKQATKQADVYSFGIIM